MRVLQRYLENTMDIRTAYRTARVDGRNIFYREAGDPGLPAIVLLHGLPSSSAMFRELIPMLADRFHVIAPDYVGFGYSDAPSRDAFAYTFDNLAAHVAGLLDLLGLERYTLYMQDYGGPVGFRMFVRQPARVDGFVIQNANAYAEGLGEGAKSVLVPLWELRTPETEQAARTVVGAHAAKDHWLAGVADPLRIDPDHWLRDQALLDRPGTQDYQLDLLEDYKTNVAAYPAWQAAFRRHQPRSLIVWGRNDPFFLPPGAQAYLRDLPDARLVWLDGGHFVLDEFAPRVAAEIKSFFAPEAQNG